MERVKMFFLYSGRVAESTCDSRLHKNVRTQVDKKAVKEQ